MEIQIKVAGDNSRQHAGNLITMIEKQDIKGIEKLELNRSAAQAGEMGTGTILDTFTAVITAASAPLTELVKCLQIYISNFKTEVEITIGDKKIVVNTSKPEKAEELVRMILESTK